MLRLRFDKVALRVIERLQVNLAEDIPAGMTAVVTITAPIRLASKTAAAVEEQVRTILRRGSARSDRKLTIHENRVRIRLLDHRSRRAPKVIGFVHTPGSNPLTALRGATVQELSAASRFPSTPR